MRESAWSWPSPLIDSAVSLSVRKYTCTRSPAFSARPSALVRLHILCTGSLAMRAKCKAQKVKASRWIRRSGAFCCFAPPELRPRDGAFYNDNDYCCDCAVDIVLAIIRKRSLGVLFWSIPTQLWFGCVYFCPCLWGLNLLCKVLGNHHKTIFVIVECRSENKFLIFWYY